MTENIKNRNVRIWNCGRFRILGKNDSAMSSLTRIILVAAIAILATVIATTAFGFGVTEIKEPAASITVGNIPKTEGIADMKIVHRGGDRLSGGDWMLSIVPVGHPPAYIASSPDSDFAEGNQIITMNVTDLPGATYYVTNTGVSIITGDSPDARLSFGQEYDVKIMVYSSRTMVLDTVLPRFKR
ncbi:Uncharacterised protein [uncultured archaeon]|nr:Uncharacterised protein [uncultured archaeon]